MGGGPSKEEAPQANGAGLSQDVASQPSEAPIKTMSKNHDINTDATETTSKVKLPHNYEAILEDADSPVDKSSTERLYDQLYAGVLLNKKNMKYWVDKKTNTNCFMLFAKDLSITWADDNRFWHWPSLKETSDMFVAAELLNVCWLEVHGKFDTAKLSPGTMYEVLFVVMLKDPSYGWEVPVNLRLVLPDGSTQIHKEDLMEKIRGRWLEIPVGDFCMLPEKVGEMEISLYEYEAGIWKKGLLIKGVTIRPKV